MIDIVKLGEDNSTEIAHRVYFAYLTISCTSVHSKYTQLQAYNTSKCKSKREEKVCLK